MNILGESEGDFAVVFHWNQKYDKVVSCLSLPDRRV